MVAAQFESAFKQVSVRYTEDVIAKLCTLAGVCTTDVVVRFNELLVRFTEVLYASRVKYVLSKFEYGLSRCRIFFWVRYIESTITEGTLIEVQLYTYIRFFKKNKYYTYYY